MCRGLQNYQNITAVDSDYPNGRSKDNTGINDGTPVKEATIGDYQQFFAKLMRIAGLAPNQLPDNEYNGIQYYDALLSAAVAYKSYVAILTQASTGAPTAVVMPNNTIGTIIWTRTGVGTYIGTKTGAFTLLKTVCTYGAFADNGLAKGFVRLSINTGNANLINLNSYDSSFAASDDVILNTPIEIRVYR